MANYLLTENQALSVKADRAFAGLVRIIYALSRACR